MSKTVIIFAIVFSLFASWNTAAWSDRKSYGDLEGVIFLGNHDGDTIRVDIPGVSPLFGENISVRVRGLDAPEIRAKCQKEKAMALEAKERVHQFLEQAKHIILKETGRDKYFRIVARVVADGVDVGDLLLNEGLAVPYDGGRKDTSWCAP